MSDPSAQAEPVRYERTDVLSARISAFSEYTPINAAASSLTVLVLAWLLYGHADGRLLTAWCALHLSLSGTVMLRWLRGRRGPRTPRTPRRAVGYALLAGLLWGSTGLLLRDAPILLQSSTIIVVGAIAAGAATTLAALPRAAVAFVLSSIVPFAVLFLAQGTTPHRLLAALAMVMAIAMLSSTRLVYRSLVKQLSAQQEAERARDDFNAARKEWLEIAHATEAFALFDAEDRLALWNRRFGDVLSIPEELLQRGTPRERLEAAASRPVAEVPRSLKAEDGEPIVRRYANDRWLRTTDVRTESGFRVVCHTDVTDLEETQKTLHMMQLAVDHSQDAMFWVRPDGRIAYANLEACRVLRRSKSDLLTMRIDDVRSSAPGQTWLEDWAHLRRHGTLSRTALLGIEDDAVVPHEIAYTFIEADGEWVFVCARDVSGRDGLGEEFLRVERLTAVGSMADSIAHDFDRLLGTIHEYVAATVSEDAGLESVKEAIRRGRVLTGQLQTLSPRLTTPSESPEDRS